MVAAKVRSSPGVPLHRPRSGSCAVLQYLQECGFILVFKQTVLGNGIVKGNCDAELVLNCVSDFYTSAYTVCILITGDGDFGCLVKFLKEKQAIEKIIAPAEHKCSILLKNKSVNITFLNTLYHKFSRVIPA